jgi:NTP pyrophosphatase (non-canonical NTP hydrolase)
MFEQAVFLELMERVRDLCHENSKSHGFWDEDKQVVTRPDKSKGGAWREMVEVPMKPWNFGEKIALIHSELSEMFEAWRKDIKESDKDITVLDSTGPRRITAIEEEMADTFIRLFDLCGKLDIDIGSIILAKMEYNKNRPHMHGGRKC